MNPQTFWTAERNGARAFAPWLAKTLPTRLKPGALSKTSRIQAEFVEKLGAAVNPELSIHVANVRFRRAGRNNHGFGNFSRGFASKQKLKRLFLTAAKAAPVGRGINAPLHKKLVRRPGKRGDA